MRYILLLLLLLAACSPSLDQFSQSLSSQEVATYRAQILLETTSTDTSGTRSSVTIDRDVQIDRTVSHARIKEQSEVALESLQPALQTTLMYVQKDLVYTRVADTWTLRNDQTLLPMLDVLPNTYDFITVENQESEDIHHKLSGTLNPAGANLLVDTALNPLFVPNYEESSISLWIDKQTHLPAWIEYQIPLYSADSVTQLQGTIRFTEYNTSIDTTLPERARVARTLQ